MKGKEVVADIGTDGKSVWFYNAQGEEIKMVIIPEARHKLLEAVAEAARDYYNNRKPGAADRAFKDKELHDRLGQVLTALDQ